MPGVDGNKISFISFHELLLHFGATGAGLNDAFGLSKEPPIGSINSDGSDTDKELPSSDDDEKPLLTEGIEFDTARIQKQNAEKLYHLLEELNFIYEALKKNENFSAYNLINYTNLLLSLKEDNDLKKLEKLLFSETMRRMNLWSDRADKSTIWTYLAFNTIGYIVALIACFSPQSQVSSVLANSWLGHSSSAGWNHWDETATLFSVPRLWQQGQKTIARINSLSALMLMGCTLLADLGVGLIAEPVIEMSAATVYGLLGFGFALATIIPAGVEFYLAKQNQKDIDLLTKKINQLKGEDEEAESVKNNTKEIRILEKAIRLITIERDHHYRSAGAWGACAIGMTAIAVVGFVALSGVSFGAVPAVMLASVGIALAAGILRKWYLESQKKGDLEKEKERTAEVFFDKITFMTYRNQLNNLRVGASGNTINVEQQKNEYEFGSQNYYEQCEQYLEAVIPDTEEDTKEIALSILEYFKVADGVLTSLQQDNGVNSQLFKDIRNDLKICLCDVVESVNYYNKAWVESFGKSMIRKIIVPLLAQIVKKDEQLIFQDLDTKVLGHRKLTFSLNEIEIEDNFFDKQQQDLQEKSKTHSGEENNAAVMQHLLDLNGEHGSVNALVKLLKQSHNSTKDQSKQQQNEGLVVDDTSSCLLN